MLRTSLAILSFFIGFSSDVDMGPKCALPRTWSPV
jgi:hypothetical protein